ncbi:PIN domain-containing protein [Microlunatus speluncae]|uniref:PIN domain-containing protein n=1 Tax=Microlunatus speluncae TaxID=2594267 RepID=UPI0012662B8B|nr:PIN domain-containing protein [Microlunatus speluncae]
MGRSLILDTGVLIAFERGRVDQSVFDDDQLSVAAVTLAEYRVGAELADTPLRAAARLRSLELFLAEMDVLEYTARTATDHAQLLAYTRRSGLSRGPHDLIIAAHAVETGRTVVSLDANARFGDLPGVVAVAP